MHNGKTTSAGEAGHGGRTSGKPPAASLPCATAGSIRPNGWTGSRLPQTPRPRDEDAAKELKKRTLTTLYNTRPQRLADAHAALDAAVAAAYGWDADISDDDALGELLALNAKGE